MAGRSLAGCLCLLLASISVIAFTPDASIHHATRRHQWDARIQHHATFRVVPRSGPAVVADTPPSPALTVPGAAVVAEQASSLPILPASVFVPPRVSCAPSLRSRFVL